MPVTAGYVSNPYQAFGDPDVPSPYTTYGVWTAADYGMLGITYPIENAGAGLTMVGTGLIWCTGIKPDQNGTATKIVVYLNSIGTGNTGLQQVGLYSQAGTLLATGTVDPFTAGGLQNATIPGTAIVAGNLYYIALLNHYSGGTPQWIGLSTNLLNANTTPPYRSFTAAGSGFATLPGSITPSAGAALGKMLFAGLAA